MIYKGRRGFTLLEVLVAFTIAAFSLIILYRSSGESLEAVEVSGRYMQAASRAQSHLAAIAAGSSFTPGESDGDDGGGYHWHLTIARASNVSQPSAIRTAELFAVEVNISWQEHGHSRAFTLNSMILDPRPPDQWQ